MAESSGKGRTIKAAETVFSIIEALHSLDGATITELARELDMSKSTINYHLNTMEANEYIIKNNGEYRLGLKFLDLGVYAREQDKLVQIARPELKRIAEETDAVGWLVVEEYDRSVHILSWKDDQAAASRAKEGMRTHFHDHSAGKAILAHLPEHRIEAILDRYGLPQRTQYTITDRSTLYEELETIRSQGYALNDNEYTIGLRAVSAPILYDGEVLGAIGLSDASHRMADDRFHKEIPEIVMGAADAIVLSLQYE